MWHCFLRNKLFFLKSLTCSPETDREVKKMKEEYDRSLRKFEGLVKKQEQLLRGKFN